jgi:hypothetical protein
MNPLTPFVQQSRVEGFVRNFRNSWKGWSILTDGRFREVIKICTPVQGFRHLAQKSRFG